jgi:NADH-quinone oxidoreductase subunit J
MIGAIVLTHRGRGDVRTPKVSRQVRRNPDEALKLMNPGVGEGMEL